MKRGIKANVMAETGQNSLQIQIKQSSWLDFELSGDQQWVFKKTNRNDILFYLSDACRRSSLF